MEYDLIIYVIFFIIIISIQYTLNKILMEIKDIKRFLIELKIKDK